MSAPESLPDTLAALEKALSAALRPVFPETASSDARYMILRRCGYTLTDMIAAPHTPVPARAREALKADLEAVLSGTPLSRIYGERAFYGLDFSLSPETLDPRPDTEVLVNLALERLKGEKCPQILDLGTGSGCILLSILKNHSGARGIGLDRAFGAAVTALGNARRHELAGRAHFLCGNWADSIDGTFDLVVSNPPYIANPAVNHLSEIVRNYDPILALAGGEDGLQAYREIFIQLPRLVKPGGRALLEIGFDQGESIVRLAEESGFSDITVHADSAGLPRVAEIFFPALWG